MLSMDKVSKKCFGRIIEYFWAKNLTSGFVQVSESFFDRCSWWRKRRWNSLYGHFSQKNAPVHASTGARAANQHASIGSAARDSLGKNVSKEVCFWLWGKDNLVQLPKTTQRYVNSGYSLFFRGSNGVSQVFVDERFINKAQFDAGFAHGLILKDGAVPAIKDPGHDSELQMVSETASNDCFVGDRSKCSSLFSSAHDMPSLFSSAHDMPSLFSSAHTTRLHSLAPPTTCLHSLAPPTRHASTL